MRNRTLCLTAVACVALVGCGSLKPFYFQSRPTYVPNVFAKNVQCNGTQCDLIVTVNNCANGDIQVTDRSMNNGPDLDISHGPANQTRSIRWTIATAGYEFPKEVYKYGLLIKSDPADEFKNPQITVNGTVLSIDYNKKAASSPGSYTYGLQLRSTTGNKDYCQLLDPWLIS